MENILKPVFKEVGSGIATLERWKKLLTTNGKLAQEIIALFSPEFQGAVVLLLQDIFAEIADLVAAAAVGSEAVSGKGLNVALDCATVAAVEKVIKDAEAGEKQAVQALQALGIRTVSGAKT